MNHYQRHQPLDPYGRYEGDTSDYCIRYDPYGCYDPHAEPRTVVFDKHHLRSTFTYTEQMCLLQAFWNTKKNKPKQELDWYTVSESEEEMDFSINSMPFSMFVSYLGLEWKLKPEYKNHQFI